MRKKVLLIIFSIFFMFVGFCNVNAEEVTDINEFTIDVESDMSNITSQIIIKVNGTLEINNNYYLKFVNKGDLKPEAPNNWEDIPNDYKDYINNWHSILFNEDSGFNEVEDYHRWFLHEDYNYAYIMRCNKDSCTVSDNPVEVQKPDLPKLSERYEIFYFEPSKDFPQATLSVIPTFPYDRNFEKSNISSKIGVINDEKLVYSVYNKEQNSLEKLMEYAIKNDGKIFDLGELFETNINELNIVDGAYYYIYTTLKDDEGLYRDLSDIILVQAKNGMLVNDINGHWDFDKEEPTSQIITTTQKPEKNPQTQEVNLSIVLMILVASVVVIILAKKKAKKLSK